VLDFHIRARFEPAAFNRKPLKYVSGTAYRVSGTSGTLSIGNSERIGDTNATSLQKSNNSRKVGDARERVTAAFVGSIVESANVETIRVRVNNNMPRGITVGTVNTCHVPDKIN